MVLYDCEPRSIEVLYDEATTLLVLANVFDVVELTTARLFTIPEVGCFGNAKATFSLPFIFNSS